MSDLQYSFNFTECQDVIIYRSLKTSSKHLEFDSVANFVTVIFPIACCKKCPFPINVKILLVVAKLQKGLIVPVLPSTAV